MCTYSQLKNNNNKLFVAPPPSRGSMAPLCPKIVRV